MSGDFIFNESMWKKTNAPSITDEIIEKLDDRYINVGENIIDQTINNLNLNHLNLSSGGYIYFNQDNTTQMTAYDPGFITNQINSFTSSNNTWTGENKYTELSIVDDVDNNKKSVISHDNNILIINNNNLSSKCYIRVYNESGLMRSYIFDYGTLSGLNDLQVSNRVFIGATGVIRLNGGLLTFQSNGGYLFHVVDGGVQRQITFNGNGNLTGVMEADIFTVKGQSIETKFLKFRDPTTFALTNSQIYQSGRDIIIENGNLPGNFKIKNKTEGGVESVFMIDQFMNVSGINDIAIRGRKITINTLEHIFENNLYTIDNKGFFTKIEIRNYDNGGVMRKIEIDPFMNMSGINDLYVQRIFFNNTLFNPASINDLITKTRNLYSQNQDQTSIEYNFGRFLFYPGADNKSSTNPIIQNKDQALVGYNISALGNNVLTLCSWTSTSTGIRLTKDEAQLYKPKVMDSLKFSDNTIQTTALNETYVTNLIENALNNMLLRIPAGTIHAYVGDTAPAGYYLCNGALKTISGHPDLWNAIGHKFSNGLTIFPDNFYLPDLRGAFLKGNGLSPLWTHTTSINIGARQNGSVGHHAHKYTDRGVTSRNVFTTTGAPQSVLQASSDQFFTDGKAYNSTTQAESDVENRPNGVGVNYIIKY